jgi:hypothetical protein
MPAVHHGAVAPSAKMTLFIKMFQEVVGENEDATSSRFSTALQVELLKRGLLTKHMLASEATVKKVETSCRTAWTTQFSEFLADTACDALLETQKAFRAAHDVGGLYYDPSPLLGGSAVVARTATSSSTTGGGTPAAGATMTTTIHTGEKMKNTSSQTWDKDRRVFISNMSALAAAYVIKYQHLWRALLESRIPLMLGPDTDLTTLGYYERLKELSGLLYENRAVDEAWSTVSQRRSVRQLRVFSDLNKFGRLLEFDFLAYQPYLLSHNDFLPESSLLRVEKKVADPDDLTLIRTALENMARVFSVVLGEKEDEYLACLKPASIRT